MTDDKEALWAQLQEIQEKEMAELKEGRDELQKERGIMGGMAADPSDIIEINAGGEIIQSHRRTLCIAEGSMFSNLFSGRWDDSCARDSQGRVFLDHDPELIKLIVNCLRYKRIEDQSTKMPPPNVPSKKQDEFCFLLKYFGLGSFFSSKGCIFEGMDYSDVQVIQPSGSEVATACLKGGEELQLTYCGDRNGHYFVACKPLLPESGKCWWKVYIDVLPNNHWIYLGIIGNLNANSNSYSDGSSYGWGGMKQVYKKGKDISEAGMWPGFVEGESLHFCFAGDENRFAMYSTTKGRLFEMADVQTSSMCIHLNFYDPTTKVTLSPLPATDRDALARKLGL